MEVQTAAPVSFTVKIAKVDADKREVEGIATQEVLDAHNQIVDHESMKKALKDWPGNIREMHGKKAVGKAVSAKTDDEARATIVRARVSKGAPDTWEKVLDGTLGYFSIAGSGNVVTEKSKDGKDIGRIFMSNLSEISLVDNPACPTAKFDIVKLADGQLTDAQPEDIDKRDIPQSERDKMPAEDFAGPNQSFPIRKPEDVAAAASSLGRAKGGPAARAKIKRKIIAIAYRKGSAYVAQLPDAWKKKGDQKDAEKVAKRAEPYDIQQALQAILVLESLLANEMFEAEFADITGETDAEAEKAEVASLRAAITYVMEFLVSEFDSQFDEPFVEPGNDSGVAMMKTADRLRIAGETFAKAMPVSWSQVDGAGRLWFAKAGARHSKSDLDMIQNMHDTSIALGAACQKDDSGMEYAKPTGTVAKEVTQTPPAELPDKVVEAKTPDVDEETPLAKTADTPVETPKQPEAPVVAAAAAAKAEQMTADPRDEQIQKLMGSVETLTKSLEAQEAARKSEVAELRTELKRIADLPMPGGPMTRAITGTPVDKRLGNEPATPAGTDYDVQEVRKALMNAIEKAQSEDVRTALAEQLIKFDRENGLGRLAVRRETGGVQAA